MAKRGSAKHQKEFLRIMTEGMNAIPDEQYRGDVMRLIMACCQLEGVADKGPLPDARKLMDLMEKNFTEEEVVGFATLQAAALIVVKTYNRLMEGMKEKAAKNVGAEAKE